MEMCFKIVAISNFNHHVLPMSMCNLVGDSNLSQFYRSESVTSFMFEDVFVLSKPYAPSPPSPHKTKPNKGKGLTNFQYQNIMTRNNIDTIPINNSALL